MNPSGRTRGLRVVSLVTRGVAAAAVVASAAVAGLVARAQPGRASSSPPAPTATTAPAAVPDDPTLQPPDQAPQPFSGPGRVTSGAS